MLSSRAGNILKSIVSQYIERAVPVSSQGVINECGLGVSPATIRNEMAHLEEEGYIIRPHTSAGGVPSDKGYRYYVESLNEVALPLAEQRLISHLFHQVEGKLEEWLSLTAALIAQLAHNVAIVTMPKPADCKFKHLELVALRDSLVLVVLVLHGARIRQWLVTFEEVISQPQLMAIANKLNAAYSGLTSSQISAKDIELFPPEQQVTQGLLQVMQAEDEQDYEEPYLDGWHFMLNQPEFAQSHQMSALMELVEQRRLLGTIIPHRLPGQGVQVIIGQENEAEIIQNYSVVLSRYGLSDQAAGAIGVIGPTRMPYARTLSTIGYLSLVLSGLVSELYGGKTSTR
jgi:heat-inducible transcriptional repressor